MHNVDKHVVLPGYGKNIRQAGKNLFQYLRLAPACRQADIMAVFVFAHVINIPVPIGLLAVEKRQPPEHFPIGNTILGQQS